MFNSKLKQQIAELTVANENLKKQYDLVHSLLLQRQDEVVTLQRTLSDLKQQPQSKLPTKFYPDLKSKIVSIIDDELGCVKESYLIRISEEVVDYLGEILDPIFYLDSDSEEDDLEQVAKETGDKIKNIL